MSFRSYFQRLRRYVLDLLLKSMRGSLPSQPSMMSLNSPTQSLMVERALESSALWAESFTESALPWKYLLGVRIGSYVCEEG